MDETAPVAYPFNVQVEPSMTMGLLEVVVEAQRFAQRLNMPVVFECNGLPLVVTPYCKPEERLAQHQALLERSRSRRERAEKPPALTVLLKTREGLTAPIRIQCPGVRLNTDSLVEADLAALPIATRAAMIDDLTAPTDWKTTKYAIEKISEKTGDQSKRGFDVTGRCEKGLPAYFQLTIMDVRHLVRDIFEEDLRRNDDSAAEQFRAYVPRLSHGHFIEVRTREQICIGSWAILTDTRYMGVKGFGHAEIGPGGLQLQGGQSS